MPVDRFTIVNVLASSEVEGRLAADRLAGAAGELRVDIRALEMTSRLPDTATDDVPPLDRIRRLDAILGRIEEDFARFRPTGAISATRVTPDQEHYFALRELADELNKQFDQLFERVFRESPCPLANAAA